jgi:CHAT domain-containing protein
VGLANVLLERGRFYDAGRAYDSVLPEFERITNPEKRIAAYYAAGRSQAFSGRPDEAAENMLKALTLARQYKVRLLEGRAMQGLGHLYQNQSDLLQSRAFFTEALKIIREENDVMALVWALGNYGVIARVDRDYPRAIELHKEAVRRSSNPVGVVRSMRELGLDYYYSGDGPAAIAAYRQALAVKLQDPRHHAYSDVKRNLAQALIEFGDGSRRTLDEAAALLADTLEDCIQVRDQLGEIGARRVLAQLLTAEGKRAAAKAEYERAFAAARAYRAKSANTEVHAGTLAHEQAAFRGYLDLVLAGVAARGPGKLEPASAAETSALYTLELARDAHFGSTRTGSLDAETTQRVDALLEQMANKSVRIAALLKQEVESAEAIELETLQLDMSKLRADLESVRTAAAAKHAATENARPTARRAWRDLAPGDAQLSYALGEKQVYVWVRTGSGIRVTVLAQGPTGLEQQLAELGSFNPQSEPGKIERALDRVSALLLPDGLLPERTNEIEIVAEGRIAGVAFPGLRLPNDRTRHLIETHTVTMISSMFAAGDPLRTRSRPFQLVALASGNGSLRSARQPDPTPRLQAATKEIRDVAALFEGRTPGAKVKLLFGAEGNASNLRGIWSSGADVVHFATHALADLQQPLASLLVMPATGADGTATYLTAGQVRDWRGDADLVFLSACESAIGPPRFASGMPGLQHAFLRAGARGVIATLWPIEDVLAQEFSADFYRRFTGGMSAVQSLRETQRVWLAGEAGGDRDKQARRRITALAHAYYTR